MTNEEELNRKAEALRGIYHNKGVELTEEEAKVLVQQLGEKYFRRAAILCVLLIVGLITFLVLRFA